MSRTKCQTKCHLNRGDSTVPELPHWPLKGSHGLRSATTRTASAFATFCWRARHRPCPGPPMRATSKPSGTGSAGALAGEGQAGPPAGPGPAGCGGGGRSLPGGGFRGSGPTVPRRLGAGMHAHRPKPGVRVATARPRAEPPRAGFAIRPLVSKCHGSRGEHGPALVPALEAYRRTAGSGRHGPEGGAVPGLEGKPVGNVEG